MPDMTAQHLEPDDNERAIIRLQDAISMQGAVIDQITTERDTAREQAHIHARRLAADREYVTWLERQLDVLFRAEENSV